MMSASITHAESSGVGALDKLNGLIAEASCTRKAEVGEIVVCGKERSKFRLPEDAKDSGARGIPLANRRGEAAFASVQRNALAECGPFQGQRHCNKAESRASGYRNGRDPFTAALRLVTLLADPDSEVPEPVRE